MFRSPPAGMVLRKRKTLNPSRRIALGVFSGGRPAEKTDFIKSQAGFLRGIAAISFFPVDKDKQF